MLDDSGGWTVVSFFCSLSPVMLVRILRVKWQSVGVTCAAQRSSVGDQSQESHSVKQLLSQCRGDIWAVVGSVSTRSSNHLFQ